MYMTFGVPFHALKFGHSCATKMDFRARPATVARTLISSWSLFGVSKISVGAWFLVWWKCLLPKASKDVVSCAGAHNPSSVVSLHRPHQFAVLSWLSNEKLSTLRRISGHFYFCRIREEEKGYFKLTFDVNFYHFLTWIFFVSSSPARGNWGSGSEWRSSRIELVYELCEEGSRQSQIHSGRRHFVSGD